MNTKYFEETIKNICNIDTSNHPKNWNKENPTEGHCAIVSVLAQELFGVDIVRVSLVGTTYENLGSHYFNIIDGKEIDFTLGQFKENPYIKVERIDKNKDEILLNPDTKRRYWLLKTRFNNYKTL